MSTYSKVAIIGAGLIGGSIGLALRERGLAAEVAGVGRRQQSLDRALQCGAIDSASTDLCDGVAGAEVVVVATPVASVAASVRQALTAAPQTALVTDAGSTKSIVCAAVAASGDDSSRFVGSHPLAGDHRTGPEFARADLLDGKVVVVTPTESTPTATVERAQFFWESLGARVLQMAPEQHDQALATTSHLPHLVASALAFNTPAEWLPLAATGWADTTRIASADPELWAQIFSQNGPSVIVSLDRLIKQLEITRSHLLAEEGDLMKKFLQQAKRTRDALGN